MSERLQTGNIGVDFEHAPAPASNQVGPLIASIVLAGALFLATFTGFLVLPRSGLARAEVIAVIWMNIGLILTAIVVEARRRPYSLHLMHLLALFLFVGAPALFQYSTGRFGVAGPIVNVRRQVLLAALTVTIWLVSYLVGYELQHRYGGQRRGPVLSFLDRPILPRRILAILILALLVVLYLAVVGLAGVATRGAAEADMLEFAEKSSASGFTLMVYLIHQMLLRAFSLIALLAALLSFARDRQNRNPLIVLLLISVGIGTFFANNPFAAARMWLATSIIGFASLFLRRLRTGWALVVIALSGITLLPSLHETRYLERLEDWWDYVALVSPLDYLAGNSDVDGLGMLALCQQWKELHGHRWGMQTAGSMLFWYPRRFWIHKPVDTGMMVTEDLGFDFTNLAPPVMSDYLVDFDFPGVLVFGALFGVLLAKVDRTYWNSHLDKARTRVIDAIYPFWIGCILYFTRGGSMASLSFTMAFTFWVLPLGIGGPRASRTGDQHD